MQIKLGKKNQKNFIIYVKFKKQLKQFQNFYGPGFTLH